MSTLRVANVHFDSTATNFIDARTPGTIRINTTNLELNATSVIQNGAAIGTPTGALLEYPWKSGDSVPTGYLRLDGNTYLRSAYSSLSSIIGSPVRLGNFTRLFQNTSLQFSDVFEANGVIFHAGTNAVGIPASSPNPSHELSSVANSIIYSRNAGVSWISAPAMGFEGLSRTESHSGANIIASKRLVAANGTGTYVITNRSATKGMTAGYGSGLQVGNAYVMVATSENLNSWSKVVLTSGTGGGTASGSIEGADGGSSAFAITFGGTQNRFVLLFTGGANYVPGVGCCTETGTSKSSRVAWSNNGTTWTFQNSGAVGFFPGEYYVNSARQTGIGATGRWINVEATSNGFVAIRNTNSGNNRANAVLTSADGIVWTDISQTLVDAGATNRLSNLSLANGLFIITPTTPSGTSAIPGANTIDGIPSLFISNNRTTWTRINTISSSSAATPFGGRNIFHNGSIYYTASSDSTRLVYSTDLVNWLSASSNVENFNIIATANVGNTIYGQGAANTATTTNSRMSITSVTHNTYNVATEFPLPNTIPSGSLVTENPFLPFTAFIKT